MFRRLRQATMAAVMVAVLLLGVPLAIIGYQMIYASQERELTNRLDNLSRAVDRRILTDSDLTADMLEPYVGATGDLPAAVLVVVPQQSASELRAGEPVEGPVWEKATVTSEGAQVKIMASQRTMVLRSLQAVLLVVMLSAIALIAGVVVASWQSRRMTKPLVYLSASAEQLGAGQVRPRMEPTGIEEIDLVAGELARSSDRMAARLAAERQFAADASHQLRTPLTALSMRLEEIQSLTDDDEVRNEARISLEQVERLTTTVEELLGRTRRESRSTSLEALRLDEVADQQREEWVGVYAAQDRDLLFDVPKGLMVVASPGALAQVLATLLENSLKHGGGTTRVSARKTGNGQGVVVEVSDEGEGVSDEIAPHIFERHVTSGQGSGLGLALARDLVAADGGRLELASRRPAVFAVFLTGVPDSLDPSRVIPRGEVIDPMDVGHRRWG